MIEDYRKSFKITAQSTGHYLWQSTKNTNGIQMLLDVTMKSKTLTFREKPLEERTQKQRDSANATETGWRHTHVLFPDASWLTAYIEINRFPSHFTFSKTLLENPRLTLMNSFNFTVKELSWSTLKSIINPRYSLTHHAMVTRTRQLLNYIVSDCISSHHTLVCSIAEL